ncbi:MAG: cysteine--tRNA ligase [Candidatus Bipolaricaulota bacterium]|nr:cysteine--tRNA ligase [Candidatus Bipolaricaulota bacterium]
MEIYNTLTRRKDVFSPQTGDTVRMYVCGPTVYDHLHIGNLRPIIVFDAFRKYMESFKGWKVNYVQNITDVDDKLIERSAKTNEPVNGLAAHYTEAYFKLLDRLNVKEPTHSPRATDHIKGMIELIAALVDKGYAYERNGNVYYRVAACPDYGKLSGRHTEELQAGARIAASEEKEDPLDFTLWKRSKPGEPRWDSPWGEGRPGWHTECVVLARKYLGETLDIHAGGNDLIFPHHENEIAQAEAVGKTPFSRFWLHNGMLSFDGEKMSKSLGNFAYAYEVLEKFDPETIRYFYLSRHYRKPLDYSEGALKEAGKALSRVYNLIAEVNAELSGVEGKPGTKGREFAGTLSRFRERYIAEMDDDLNTVGGIAAIQELASAANRFRLTATGADRLALVQAIKLIRELGFPLGLFQREERNGHGIEDELIRLLIDLRGKLRDREEFALADFIRARLNELGISIKDTAQGTIWT